MTYQTTKNYQMELCPDSATLFFYFLRCGWLHPRFKYVFVLVSTDLVGLTWLSEDVALTDSSTPLFSSSSVCRYGCDCVLLFFGFTMHTHTHTHTHTSTHTHTAKTDSLFRRHTLDHDHQLKCEELSAFNLFFLYMLRICFCFFSF